VIHLLPYYGHQTVNRTGILPFENEELVKPHLPIDNIIAPRQTLQRGHPGNTRIASTVGIIG
jgi:hypothetical protein